MTYVSNMLGMGGTPERLRQLYGVEIEVEGCRNYDWALDGGQWRPVADGSLRGNGMEFITPPVEYARLKTMLMAYYQAHYDNGYIANARTGIHVHMDMRHRTLEQVGAICAVYSIVEPILFDICGADREEGIYCVPWYRATEDAKLLRKAMDEEDRHMSVDALMHTCKYAALYLEPLTRLGTIEFRAAPTFVTYEEMMIWVDAIRRLVTFGDYRGTPESVLDYDLERMIEFIFPGLDVPYAVGRIEEHDCLGVASYLVRTKPKLDWTFPEGEPMAQTGVYYQHAGGGGRMGIRPRFVEPEFIDEPDEYNEEEEY